MTSPDASTYINLTPYDLTPAEILQTAVLYARSILPELEPRAGSLETVVWESIASQAALVVEAINRVPDSLFVGLLKLFAIERSNGERATAAITLTSMGTNEFTIPSTTKLAFFPSDNTEPLVWSLDEDVTMSAGSASATGAITAVSIGTEYNVPSEGDALQILSSSPNVQSVVFSTAPTGGLASETDTEYFDRAISKLASYTSSIALPSQFEAKTIDTHTDAYRVKAYDLRRETDRDTTDLGYTTHPGYILMVVSGASAIPLSAEKKDDIVETLEEASVSSLIVEIGDAVNVPVKVTATATVQDGSSSTAVQTAVEDALEAYLNANSWDWSATVRKNEIISLIDQVDGVDFVDSVTLSIDGGETEATVSGGDVVLHQLGTLVSTLSGGHDITISPSA